jgi:hypothetical protein
MTDFNGQPRGEALAVVNAKAMLSGPRVDIRILGDGCHDLDAEGKSRYRNSRIDRSYAKQANKWSRAA